MIVAMLREDSQLASYTPDMAVQIDGEHDDLIEQFAEVAAKWQGVLPRTRLELTKAAVAMLEQAVAEHVLEGVYERAEVAAHRVAAIAAFRVIELMTKHENPAMMKACLAVAIGAEERSQTVIAKEFGVEKATISKWARFFVEYFQLVPGRGMRRPDAVAAYQDRARKVWGDRFAEQKAA